MTLQVNIEREGRLVKAGEMTSGLTEGVRFSYAPDYLQRPDAAAISCALPLQEEPFDAVRTRIFFEGLLPEGFTRRSVAQWLRADAQDYLSILSGLGRECLGALQIQEPGIPAPEPRYEPLDEAQVAALAREGVVRSAELVTEAHLSLTGASGKAGLYYDAGGNRWYLPKGSAPSTHIVKQSHVRLESIVVNEQLCMLTAKHLGLPVPQSFVLNTGEGQDEDVLFATARYDRRIAEDAGKIGELPCPRRLHQEDLAQALGIPSTEKYEKKPNAYLPRIFSLLRSRATDPIGDQLRLWDALVFHFLIGNTDGHIKNFSLLYSDSLQSLSLAPLYDIVSTCVYEQSTRDMALSIDGMYRLEEIRRSHFQNAASLAGLGGRIAMQHLDRLCGGFEEALKAAAEELSQSGFESAKSLRERILQKGGWQWM